MAHHPVREIRKFFVEMYGYDLIKKNMNKPKLSMSFIHCVVQHPDAIRIALSLDIKWMRRFQALRFLILQDSAMFEPWDADEMHAFFGRFTAVLNPYLAEHVPEWTPLSAGMNPIYLEGRSGCVPAYYTTIECAQYDDEAVAELALHHFSAGVDAMVLSQSIFESLKHKKRVVDFDACVREMHEERERQVAGLSEVPNFSVALQ